MMTGTMTEDRDVALVETPQASELERRVLDDPEQQQLRRYGLLFFLLLGLYAVAFVMLGVWLPP